MATFLSAVPPSEELPEALAILFPLAYRELGHQTLRRHLLRDIFGNPFRPVTIDSTWLHWQAGLVGRLARDLYDTCRFQEMPVLADALEDAGCGDQTILTHLRSANCHARGCWVLDGVLGL
jgi:hypothetical protein